MKYYYTDPLAAAWMAKYHEIKICPDSREFPNPTGATFNNAGLLSFAALNAMGAPKRRYEIHHDSLHLLEAKEGDILMAKSNREAWIHSADWTCEEGFSIIQRNGTAFMWPECES